jgi:hypothetical protein
MCHVRSENSQVTVILASVAEVRGGPGLVGPPHVWERLFVIPSTYRPGGSPAGATRPLAPRRFRLRPPAEADATRTPKA